MGLNSKRIGTWSLALAAAMMLTACGSSPTRVDAGNDPDAMVSYGMDYEDWQAKSAELAQSLLASGVLNSAPNQPAVLAIDLFRNKTGEQAINAAQLTDTMRVALSRTGKVQTTYAYNLGGRSEAVVAQGVDQEAEFMSDGQAAAPKAPDFTLSGVITRDTIRSGRDRQATYVIKVSLAKTGGGGTFIWEDQAVVRKRGTKAAVSF